MKEIKHCLSHAHAMLQEALMGLCIPTSSSTKFLEVLRFLLKICSPAMMEMLCWSIDLYMWKTRILIFPRLIVNSLSFPPTLDMSPPFPISVPLLIYQTRIMTDEFTDYTWCQDCSLIYHLDPNGDNSHFVRTEYSAHPLTYHIYYGSAIHQDYGKLLIVKIGHNHWYFEYFLASSLLPRLAFVLPLIALIKFSTICWWKHSMNFGKTIKWSYTPYSFVETLHSFIL